jgi:hypothetical protein
MQTKPAIAPLQNEFKEIFLRLCLIISIKTHDKPPTHADKFDTRTAFAALEFTENSLPPCKFKKKKLNY